MTGLSWTFAGLCNEATAKPERPMLARDYLWASELSIAPIDVISRMRGIMPSTPPNDRSMRKFHAGNVWESYVYLVLSAAGILHASQDHLEFQYPDLLKVTGRLDFVAGGVPDWEKARALTRQLAYLEPMRYFIENMVTNFEKTYGNQELKEIVIEAKSVSSNMFPKYQLSQKPNPGHAMQCFHYMKATGMDEGHVFYVSKDDSFMLEFPIANPGPVEDEYRKHIEMLTKYYRSGEMPEKEKEVIWDGDLCKFQKNWKVEYSNYLELYYGYKTPEEYRNAWASRTASWNRVMGRCVRNEKMTENNLRAIEDARLIFPEFSSLIDTAKEKAKADPSLLEEVSDAGTN